MSLVAQLFQGQVRQDHALPPATAQAQQRQQGPHMQQGGPVQQGVPVQQGGNVQPCRVQFPPISATNAQVRRTFSWQHIALL